MEKLKIVESNSNVVKMPNANNLQVIELLEGLLEKAKHGEIVGICGAFMTKRDDVGHYLTGLNCERPMQTINDLIKLQVKIQSS